MRFYASLLSLTFVLLAACGEQQSSEYGFAIRNVTVNNAYRSLAVRMQQELTLSGQAVDALEHGVVLTLVLQLELHNDNNLMVVREDEWQYQLRYLPLSERYQLSGPDGEIMQVYPRLRHALAAIGNLNLSVPTGPMLPGKYELRTRIYLDESRLPTPMQLPAWFSGEWQHDSEWSVWPFEISA